MMAEGIYTAMTTTVAGLLVVLGCLFRLQFFVTRVDRVVYKLRTARWTLIVARTCLNRIGCLRSRSMVSAEVNMLND